MRVRSRAAAKNTDMLRGSALSRVLLFSAPLMAGNLFTQLYSLIDAAVVGRFVGVNAFAAIGCTGWVAWLLIALCRDSSNAICIMGSVRVGANRPDEFKRVQATAAYIGFVLAAVACTLLLSCMDTVLRINRVPAEIYQDAKTYLTIYTLAVPLNMLCGMASALLRASGNSRVPFLAMTVSAAVNVVLDLYFVLSLHAGVAGVAWATLIAQGVAAIIALLGLSGRELFSMRRRDWRPDGALLREAFSLWSPMFLNSVVITVGGVYVQSCVNAVGAAFSAGYTAAVKIFNLFEAVVISVQTALSVFIGQNLGARQLARVRKGFFQTLAVSMLLMALLAVGSFAFGDPVIGAFLSHDDPAAYRQAFETARRQLRFMMTGTVLMVPMYFFRMGAQTIGRPNSTFVAGVVQMIARILTIVLLSDRFGAVAYHLTDPAAWAASLPVVAVPFLRDLRVLEQSAVQPPQGGEPPSDSVTEDQEEKTR